MITPIARFAVRFAVPVLIGWALVVVVFGFIGRGVEDKVQPSLLFIPGTESQRWREERAGSFNETLLVLLVGPQRQVDRQGRALVTALERRPLTRAISPWSGDAKQLQSLRPSPTQAVISVDLTIPPGGNINTVIGPLKEFVNARVGGPVRAHLAGIPSLGSEVNKASIEALHKGELIAAPMLIIVLLLVFRSPIAAAIPLVIAVGTVITGFGILSLILEFADLDAVALSAASMIGLALGVDYSLLIVTRFRESLAEGNVPRQAASIAANTAGRTANFAGVVLLGDHDRRVPPLARLDSALDGARDDRRDRPQHDRRDRRHARRDEPAGRAREHVADRRRSERGAGAIARIVRRVSRRPALAAGTARRAAARLRRAACWRSRRRPRTRACCPKHSDGLAAFRALRAAKLGPEVDVALAAPKGTLLDPARLEQIERLERRIEATPLVRAVMGPGLIADSTTEVRAAPKQIGRSRRDLASAEGELTARSRQLERARRKARRQAADLGVGLRQATDLLDSGRGLLAATSARGGDFDRLVLGLTVARDGARQLADGTQTLGTQAGRLAGGLREIRKRVDGLVPSIAAGQSALRDAQARLNLLRIPAQTNERELESALAALDRAGAAGKADAAVQEARQHVIKALARGERQQRERRHRPATRARCGADARARAGERGRKAGRRRGPHDDAVRRRHAPGRGRCGPARDAGTEHGRRRAATARGRARAGARRASSRSSRSSPR